MLPLTVRIIAIDYGTKRIGFALYDTTVPIVVPRIPLTPKSEEEAIEVVCSIVLDESFDKIVLGLPLNMDGSEGKMVEMVRAFGDRLAQGTGIEVDYIDERLTSREAGSRASSSLRKKRDGKIDSLSASLILEAYVETIR